MVAPNFDIYKFPESVEDIIFEDKKKKAEVKDHQVLLYNLRKGETEVVLRRSVMRTEPIDLPTLSLR